MSQKTTVNNFPVVLKPPHLHRTYAESSLPSVTNSTDAHWSVIASFLFSATVYRIDKDTSIPDLLCLVIKYRSSSSTSSSFKGVAF